MKPTLLLWNSSNSKRFEFLIWNFWGRNEAYVHKHFCSIYVFFKLLLWKHLFLPSNVLKISCLIYFSRNRNWSTWAEAGGTSHLSLQRSPKWLVVFSNFYIFISFIMYDFSFCGLGLRNEIFKNYTEDWKIKQTIVNGRGLHFLFRRRRRRRSPLDRFITGFWKVQLPLVSEKLRLKMPENSNWKKKNPEKRKMWQTFISGGLFRSTYLLNFFFKTDCLSWAPPGGSLLDLFRGLNFHTSRDSSLLSGTSPWGSLLFFICEVEISLVTENVIVSYTRNDWKVKKIRIILKKKIKFCHDCKVKKN